MRPSQIRSLLSLASVHVPAQSHALGKDSPLWRLLALVGIETAVQIRAQTARAPLEVSVVSLDASKRSHISSRSHDEDRECFDTAWLLAMLDRDDARGLLLDGPVIEHRSWAIPLAEVAQVRRLVIAGASTTLVSSAVRLPVELLGREEIESSLMAAEGNIATPDTFVSQFTKQFRSPTAEPLGENEIDVAQRFLTNQFGSLEHALVHLRGVAHACRDRGEYRVLMVYLECLYRRARVLIADSIDFWEWWLFCAIALGYPRSELAKVPIRMLEEFPSLALMMNGSRGRLAMNTDPDIAGLPGSAASNHLRQLGLHSGLQGDSERALQLLEAALESLPPTGETWQRAKIAAAFSAVMLARGDIRSMLTWARRGLQTLASRSTDIDVLLLRELRAQELFGTLLTSEVGPTQRKWAHEAATNVDLDIARVPHMDFVLGTVADLLFVEGSFKDAHSLYEAVYEAASEEARPLLAPDVAKSLCLLGRHDEALEFATETASSSGAYGVRPGIVGRYCQALVHAATGARSTAEIREELLRVIDASRQANYFLMGLQSSVLLFALCVRGGQPYPFNRIGELFANEMSSLSESGWAFYSVSLVEPEVLRSAWQDATPLVDVSFEGPRVAVKRVGEHHHLSARMSETLVCLDLAPDGLSSQQLGIALFGDEANASTIKATVSRLRSFISIDSNPYRIGEPYRSHVRRLRIALERGFFREALDLYPGPLMPESEAPMIVDERNALATALREGVIGRGDPELMYSYVQKVPDDIDVWTELEQVLGEDDPRRGIAAARIHALLEGIVA